MRSLLYITFFFTSCSYNTIENSTCNSDTPSFSECVDPIIVNECISCHSYAGSAEMLNLTIDVNIQEAVLNGTLIERINSSTNPMPPAGKLPESSLEIINRWADNGALIDTP